LGTIYSTMYRYDEGKYRYEKSIEQGKRLWGFNAIAYYNLSLLELRFHQYDLAMDSANASLDSSIRASGYLSRGELFMRRFDMEKALADYDTAREIDPSPLAKLSLAQAYRISGRLEEARLYAENCLKTGDHSWMSNYGIDPVRYKRDIYEILYKTYKGLAKTEKFIPRYSLVEKAGLFFKKISFRFYSSVYRKLYQKYSLAAGEAMRKELPSIDMYIQYFNAFETYRYRAASYLNMARDLEVAVIPASEPSYNLEEGVLFNNLGLIGKALLKFDENWERLSISQCFSMFARRGGNDVFRACATELFALNRGALLQDGIRLPVDMKINFVSKTGEMQKSRNEKKTYRVLHKVLRKALVKAGFMPDNSGVSRFGLEITVHESPAQGQFSSEFSVSCTLTDAEGAVYPLHRIFPLRSLSKRDIYDFAGIFGNYVFKN